jgi:hypothetical protein
MSVVGQKAKKPPLKITKIFLAFSRYHSEMRMKKIVPIFCAKDGSP